MGAPPRLGRTGRAFFYLGEPAKYARIAQAMGVNTWGMTVSEAAAAAVDAVTAFVKLLEIPSVAELGVKEEDIPMLVDMAYNDPQTIGNPRDLLGCITSSSIALCATFDTGNDVC
jgi:alcohol dehydrogenase class IV